MIGPLVAWVLLLDALAGAAQIASIPLPRIDPRLFSPQSLRNLHAIFKATYTLVYHPMSHTGGGRLNVTPLSINNVDRFLLP
jgi:hypothetical protein